MFFLVEKTPSLNTNPHDQCSLIIIWCLNSPNTQLSKSVGIRSFPFGMSDFHGLLLLVSGRVNFTEHPREKRLESPGRWHFLMYIWLAIYSDLSRRLGKPQKVAFWKGNPLIYIYISGKSRWVKYYSIWGGDKMTNLQYKHINYVNVAWCRSISCRSISCRPDTPPKFNIAPEKLWLEDYFPIGKVTFQGLC